MVHRRLDCRNDDSHFWFERRPTGSQCLCAVDYRVRNHEKKGTLRKRSLFFLHSRSPGLFQRSRIHAEGCCQRTIGRRTELNANRLSFISRHIQPANDKTRGSADRLGEEPRIVVQGCNVSGNSAVQYCRFAPKFGTRPLCTVSDHVSSSLA